MIEMITINKKSWHWKYYDAGRTFESIFYNITKEDALTIFGYIFYVISGILKIFFMVKFPNILMKLLEPFMIEERD
jgi:hypothetical protein